MERGYVITFYGVLIAISFRFSLLSEQAVIVYGEGRYNNTRLCVTLIYFEL